MKTKLLFLMAFLVCSMPYMHSQSKVYVIFTSTDSEVKGVWNYKADVSIGVRDDRYFFTFFDRAGGDDKQSYFYSFIYENLNENPNNAISYKPKSFLKTITPIDWDKISSKSDAEVKYKQILSYNEIYFIDRNEVDSSSIKMYPVKKLIRPEY